MCVECCRGHFCNYSPSSTTPIVPISEPDPCGKGACLNGAKCSKGVCDCSSKARNGFGFSGTFCHIYVDACQGVQCGNGGECKASGYGHYCDCSKAKKPFNIPNRQGRCYGQDTIIDICSGVRCLHHGICNNISGTCDGCESHSLEINDGTYQSRGARCEWNTKLGLDSDSSSTFFDQCGGVKCGPGEYQDELGQTMCKSCPSGTSHNLMNQTSVLACVDTISTTTARSSSDEPVSGVGLIILIICIVCAVLVVIFGVLYRSTHKKVREMKTNNLTSMYPNPVYSESPVKSLDSKDGRRTAMINDPTFLKHLEDVPAILTLTDGSSDPVVVIRALQSAGLRAFGTFDPHLTSSEYLGMPESQQQEDLAITLNDFAKNIPGYVALDDSKIIKNPLDCMMTAYKAILDSTSIPKFNIDLAVDQLAEFLSHVPGYTKEKKFHFEGKHVKHDAVLRKDQFDYILEFVSMIPGVDPIEGGKVKPNNPVDFVEKLHKVIYFVKMHADALAPDTFCPSQFGFSEEARLGTQRSWVRPSSPSTPNDNSYGSHYDAVHLGDNSTAISTPQDYGNDTYASVNAEFLDPISTAEDSYLTLGTQSEVDNSIPYDFLSPGSSGDVQNRSLPVHTESAF